jgi:hypothetical protein
MPVYIKPSNPDADDRFGISVAIDGDTLVVGAPGEDGAGAANPDDDSAAGAGAAYVFVRSAGGWTQQAYLKASNTGVGTSDQFGVSVAVHGDTVAVGSPLEGSNATGIDGDQANELASGAGAVYVFVRSGTTWRQEAYVKASNTAAGDTFGISLALDQDLLAVGAYNEGSAAVNVGGDQADNSALRAGAVYMLSRSSGVWSHVSYIKASNTGTADWFGYEVALKGGVLAVGAGREDSAATGFGGDANDNSVTDAGAAYVLVRSGATWSPFGYFKALNPSPQDSFGFATGISAGRLVVGAPLEDGSASRIGGPFDDLLEDAGAVYVFE